MKHVLIIEDNTDILKLLGYEFLKYPDITTHPVTNVSDMWGVPIGKIDGILTDFMLQNYQCGYFIRKLWESGGLRGDVPIVVFTALADLREPKKQLETYKADNATTHPIEVYGKAVVDIPTVVQKMRTALGL